MSEILDQLYAARQAEKSLLAQYQVMRDAIMPELPPAIVEQLEALETEFKPKIDAAAENIARIEAQAKQEILELGATIKGTYITGVYNRGRVSWDTKALDGFAAGHPEILPFRRIGDPYVTFRE